MEPDGKWKLSPAFDVIYSHNPQGKWTNQHQMSLNGKRDDFSLQDLIEVGESISIAKPETVINEVVTAVEKWPEYAKTAGIKSEVISDIAKYQRTTIIQ